MLSNNGLCLHTTVQYMLLFLVLAVNSVQFQILRSNTLLLDQAARSCALLWLTSGGDSGPGHDSGLLLSMVIPIKYQHVPFMVLIDPPPPPQQGCKEVT